jgi:dihydrofolate reductase
MRKIHVYLMVSLDGYFEGPNHDLSWHNVDEEFNQFAISQLRDTGLMLFGRSTYQLMEGYWPKVEEDPKTTPDDVEVARLMNNTPKMVISRTLNQVKEGPNWKNVTLRNKLDVSEIKKLKQQTGKDIWAGGSELATSLLKEGLVDEVRLMVAPVVVGAGTPLFKGLDTRMKFKLAKTQPFKSGNVLLSYEPFRDSLR